MRTSCLDHPSNDPLIIVRKWIKDFCFDNQCRANINVTAALISFFAYWHDIKTEQSKKSRIQNDIAEGHGDKRTQDESFWQFHTNKELEDGILSIGKKDSISAAIDFLGKIGILKVSRNPNPRHKFDQTRWFLFDPSLLNEWEKSSSENPHSSSENPRPSVENPHSSSENCEPSFMYPKITTKITNIDYKEEEGGGKKVEAIAAADATPATLSLHEKDEKKEERENSALATKQKIEKREIETRDGDNKQTMSLRPTVLEKQKESPPASDAPPQSAYPKISELPEHERFGAVARAMTEIFSKHGQPVPTQFITGLPRHGIGGQYTSLVFNAQWGDMILPLTEYLLRCNPGKAFSALDVLRAMENGLPEAWKSGEHYNFGQAVQRKGLFIPDELLENRNMGAAEFTNLWKNLDRPGQILCKYAGTVGLDFCTTAAWRQYYKENLDHAKKLEGFTDEEIGKSISRMQCADYLSELSLKTVVTFMFKTRSRA